MKRVLTAVILIPLVVLALFLAPMWLFTLLVLAVAVLAAREFLAIVEADGFRPFRGLSYLFLVCGFLVQVSTFVTDWRWFQNFGAAAFVAGMSALAVLLVSPLVLLVASMRRDPLAEALPDAAVSFMVLPYVGVTLSCMVTLRAMENGALFLLYVMLLVWTGDIAALYVGRAIGKHKLALRVSPGKTWEGAIASVLGAVVAALLLFHFLLPIYKGLIQLHLVSPYSVAMVPREPAPIWLVVLFAVCINVAAQLGDLVESAMKRGAGLKDSGSLLPGHGGMLDRIDALLFALPVAILFYFGGLSVYLGTSIIRS
ncbi:MAG TPA: phosphatidate cytidylyltransferase [Candidatus Limnocylindrales bacterium]|nr:phosphatidate cytidylyltransferase [Candidatus Limnocylindrales bacterium]